jgi:hypothetical protein
MSELKLRPPKKRNGSNSGRVTVATDESEKRPLRKEPAFPIYAIGTQKARKAAATKAEKFVGPSHAARFAA